MLSLETGLTRVESVAFHPAGNLVAAGGRGVELWDVRTPAAVWQTTWKYDSVKTLVFTPDGRCLLALVPGWRCISSTSSPAITPSGGRH
jgi:WD40 repeat protein